MADRPPARAVPSRDVARPRAARGAESSSHEECEPAAIVEPDQRRHPGAASDVREALSERRPARSVPLRDVARGRSARAREGSAGVERGSRAIVEDLERGAGSAELAGERRPARSVPPRDEACRHSACVREPAAGVERGSRSVVEERERAHPARDPLAAAERRPAVARAAPARDAVRRERVAGPVESRREDPFTAIAGV